MKKQALIFSDSHGNIYEALKVIERYKGIDAVFHAGDIEGEEDRLRNAIPGQVCIVRGNCDVFRTGMLPEKLCVPFGGKKIAICHGHRYLNHGNVDLLKYMAKEMDADMVIFGHTHVPFLECSSDMIVVNPGSIAKPRQSDHQPTYGWMEIDGGKLKLEIRRAADAILEEMKHQVEYFKSEDKLIEAQRIAERTNFDVEMMKETGFCSGIENYSRHLTGLAPGQPPYTLMDYFGDDFLLIIDESHKTVPQVGGMYAGDQSRKQTLVDYGFRLPSAKDNRPLSFDEFENKLDQVMFVSATPGEYEYDHELLRAEQIIRPTGLLDPKVEVRPIEGQIDDLVAEVNKEIEKKNKVLITTLTKRMAEDLTDYMKDLGIRVRYLHSDIDTLERAEIIRDMRLDVFDVLVGINLLREGLDIPEITLVAILDADKEGFLRSETSLVQTIGRAARNSEGHVIMYADNMTESMEKAISETERRRAIQEAYNREHGITPTTIKKAVRDLIAVSKKVAETEVKLKKDPESMNRKELTKVIAQVEKQMRAAAADLNFEQAAELRDKMLELKKNLEELTE